MVGVGDAVGAGLLRGGHDRQRKEVGQAGEVAQDHREPAGTGGEGGEVETEEVWAQSWTEDVQEDQPYGARLFRQQ